MKILFVHQNFPAQFKHVAPALAADPQNEVVAIGAEGAREVPRVALHRYAFEPQDVARTHPFARQFDIECRRAERILYVAARVAESGFVPDVVVAHSGWGEALPLRTLFPGSRIVAYCEYFYNFAGQDVHYDPEFPGFGLDGATALQARNAGSLLALAQADFGLAPTEWQRSTYPAEFRHKIAVIHEGIDTRQICPDSAASFKVPGGPQLRQGDEVLTYSARNLEPLRGYHIFMRALPEILRARPKAHVVIIGDDRHTYGPPAPKGTTWRQTFLAEVAGDIDQARVHFAGWVPHAAFVKALQVSRAHVYLTYPFVLSWSLLEAMSAGCTVIASDCAPVGEFIDADTGLLVPFFEPRRLAETAIAALANPGAFAHLGLTARRRMVDRFDCETVTVPAMQRLLGAASGVGPLVPIARGEAHKTARAQTM